MKSDSENPEGKVEGQPVETGRPKKEKKPASGTRLPFLLEFTYSISTLLLIVLALMVVITSYLAGASLYILVLRTVIAVLVLGGLLMVIAAQISSGLLFATRIEQEEAERKLQEMTAEQPLPSLFDEEQNKVEA